MVTLKNIAEKVLGNHCLWVLQATFYMQFSFV